MHDYFKKVLCFYISKCCSSWFLTPQYEEDFHKVITKQIESAKKVWTAGITNLISLGRCDRIRGYSFHGL